MCTLLFSMQFYCLYSVCWYTIFLYLICSVLSIFSSPSSMCFYLCHLFLSLITRTIFIGDTITTIARLFNYKCLLFKATQIVVWQPSGYMVRAFHWQYGDILLAIYIFFFTLYCLWKINILYYTMLCYAMLCYAMLCYAMLCYAMLCYAMLCYAMLCYAMLCYAMLCYAMLCYAMLCYAMLCYAMLCYAILYYNILYNTRPPCHRASLKVVAKTTASARNSKCITVV